MTKKFAMRDQNALWMGIQLNVLCMGSKQSPSLSKCCIRKLIEVAREIDPPTADQMDKLTYFDDITLGLSYEEAKKAYEENGNQGIKDSLIKRVQIVNTLLDYHNLQIKNWMSPESAEFHEVITGKSAKPVTECSTLGL